MKKTIALHIAILFAGFSFSQTLYVPNGTSGIGTSLNGNVGIGTTSPQAKFHIIDNSTGEVLRVESSSNSSQIKLRSTGTGGIDWSLMSTADGASLGGGKFSIYGNSQHRFVLDKNGYVGIGTTSPSANLQLTGLSQRLIFSTSTSQQEESARIEFWEEETGINDRQNAHFAIQYDGAGDRLRFKGKIDANNLDADLMTIRRTGYVGIGVTNPSQKLEVNGTTLSTNFKSTAGNTDYHHFIRNGGGTAVYINQVSSTSGNAILRLSSGTSTANQNVKFTVENNGYVGIGTTDPKSLLSVNGQIRATEVKVMADIQSVPDYVFEADYELRSLKETKAYIAENKHLPEIPSAAEIGENGLDLGEMNLKLLKKIEELTLYQIQLLERLENVESELQTLKTGK